MSNRAQPRRQAIGKTASAPPRPMRAAPGTVTTEAVARVVARVLPAEAPYAYHKRLAATGAPSPQAPA